MIARAAELGAGVGPPDAVEIVTLEPRAREEAERLRELLFA